MKKQKMITFLMVILLASSFLPTIAHADEVEEPEIEIEEPEIEEQEEDPETETNDEQENNGKKLGHIKEPKTMAARNGLDKGKSPVEHLYLYEKDPTSWEITEKGAWGKLTILTHKDKYIFNAHRLQKATKYALINYAQGEDWDNEDDPWAKEDILIGSGETGEKSNLHIMGEWSDTIHGKVWLVNSVDYNNETQQMTGWNPEGYLFEYDLLPSQIEIEPELAPEETTP